MHIKCPSEESDKVQAILLDGKAIKLCYEADEEEGWVKYYYPKFSAVSERVMQSLADADLTGGQEVENVLEGAPADVILVQKWGNVKIIMNDE